jgi:hypothetical protein
MSGSGSALGVFASGACVLAVSLAPVAVAVVVPVALESGLAVPDAGVVGAACRARIDARVGELLRVSNHDERNVSGCDCGTLAGIATPFARNGGSAASETFADVMSADPTATNATNAAAAIMKHLGT